MKLKVGLLYTILENPSGLNKYSYSYLNLKNVIDIEEKEGFKFSEHILKEFEEITKWYNSFINGIPLSVVESYYRLSPQDLEKYIYIDYNENEIADLKIIDIYLELENFFNRVFGLACEIANFYNIEIKINNKNPNGKINTI